MDLSPPSYILGRIPPSQSIHALRDGRTLCGVRRAHTRDVIPAPHPTIYPTCKSCLKIIRNRERTEAAVVPPPDLPPSPFSAPLPAASTSFTTVPDAFLAWEETMDHLFSAMRRQVARLGTTDASPALALEFTLLPLLRRYMLGDRSPDLYQSIWHLDHP